MNSNLNVLHKNYLTQKKIEFRNKLLMAYLSKKYISIYALSQFM